MENLCAFLGLPHSHAHLGYAHLGHFQTQRPWNALNWARLLIPNFRYYKSTGLNPFQSCHIQWIERDRNANLDISATEAHFYKKKNTYLIDLDELLSRKAPDKLVLRN